MTRPSYQPTAIPYKTEQISLHRETLMMSLIFVGSLVAIFVIVNGFIRYKKLKLK